MYLQAIDQLTHSITASVLVVLAARETAAADAAGPKPPRVYSVNGLCPVLVWLRPSLTSLMVSEDVKHQSLFTYLRRLTSPHWANTAEGRARRPQTSTFLGGVQSLSRLTVTHETRILNRWYIMANKIFCQSRLFTLLDLPGGWTKDWKDESVVPPLLRQFQARISGTDGAGYVMKITGPVTE